jgi:hypothetical protein
MNIAPEDTAAKALHSWIRALVLQDDVIDYWAGLRIHAQCLKNVYKIIKIIAHQPVKLVLAGHYLQLFGDRYPYMRLPRVPQILGELQFNLALNFETHSKRYFLAPPTTNSLTGTPIYTRFKGDRYFPDHFPRRELISSIVALYLLAAERQGILFPILFLLKAALRKALVKTKVAFLAEIEEEIMHPSVIRELRRKCTELSREEEGGIYS